MHAGGPSHALEFCCTVFLLDEASSECLHSCSSFFFDLALCLVVSGHASTHTCAQGSAGLHAWWSLHALFTHSCFTHRLASPSLGYRSRLLSRVFSFVCTLFCRSASLCPAPVRPFWTESAPLSELPVSALLRTLLSCASALFIFVSHTCLPAPSGSSEAVFA